MSGVSGRGIQARRRCDQGVVREMSGMPCLLYENGYQYPYAMPVTEEKT
ncbi:hypothetical protein SAMN05421595_3067 [Austwickia chelonae]|nr:hypothetical protein SAMN05421595_3067 [Austwickia chelonae]